MPNVSPGPHPDDTGARAVGDSGEPRGEDQPVTLVPVAVAGDAALTQPVESACLALLVVSDYARLTGTSKTAPVRDLVVDLVADLAHLCAQSGISFDAVVEEAGAIVAADCAESLRKIL